MPSFSSSDALGAVQRRIQDVAGARSPTAQAIVLSEAVMWLWMLAESFNALALLVGEDRARLNGLFFARHKGLHEAIALSEVSDRLSDYLTQMYGSPVWTRLPPARSKAENQAEEVDYKRLLEGRLVLDAYAPRCSAPSDRPLAGLSAAIV